MDDHTPETALKRCPQCKQEYPATVEYFKKAARRKSGITSPCRNCLKIMRQDPAHKAKKRIRDRAYYSRPEVQERERRRKSTPEYKVREKEHKCSAGYREKERERDRKRRLTPEYQERVKHYRLRPDIQAREHKRNDTPEKREYSRNYQRRRRLNPEFIEKEREYKNAPEVKEIYRIHVRRRRARKADLPDTFTPNDWQRALDYFGGCCAVCGRQPGLWHKLSADHWTAITKGGATTPGNIVPLCCGQDGCNNSKSNRDAEDWLTDKFGKRKAKQILKKIHGYFDSL